jgi:hypothetical protein
MAQITLYLDDETETRMRAAAKAAGLSQSRWVSELIREKTSDEWPASVACLVGAWADLPTVEELRRGEPCDAPREPV